LLFNQSVPVFQRFLSGASSFLKITVISLLIFFWITVTSTAEIISSLFFLPNNLKLLLTMTFYFIPSIIIETEQISAVQKSRGLKTFIFNPFPLIVPLLHRVMARAEGLSLTIASRGYENH
jgi:energy-coupling factor transporter transmembrane protein EcfT